MTLEYADPAVMNVQPDHQCPVALDEDATRPFRLPPVGAGAERDAGRAALSLDGAWDFRFCGDATAEESAGAPWRTCLVPGPWQAQFADLRERNGRALYRRGFDLPADWAGSALFLRFGAVSYHARVRVNGRLAAEHEGGYLPFEAEIGSLARPGRNEVSVE